MFTAIRMVIGTTYICGIVLSTVVKHWQWQWQRGWHKLKDKNSVILRYLRPQYLSLKPGHVAVTVNCRVSWLAMVMV